MFKYKKHICLFFCGIIALMLFFSSIIPVFAAPRYEADDFSGIRKTCYQMAEVVYGEPTALMDDVKDVIMFESDGDATEEDIWATVTSIYNFLSPIGLSICFLYFLIDLLDKTTRDQLSPEHFFRQFMKLIIALFIINNGMDVLVRFLEFNNYLIENITLNAEDSSIAANTDELNAIGDTIKPSNIMGMLYALMYIVVLLIPYGCISIAQLYIILTAWARILEIGIRGAMAPIGMSDMITDGLKGSGFRYLKKFIAVLIQGVIILVTMSLAQSLYGALSGVAGQVQVFPIQSILVLFAEIGIIKRASSFANDVLGV